MFTVCRRNNVINAEEIGNFDTKERFLRQSTKIIGTVTESSNGIDTSHELNFNTRTLRKLKRMIKNINECMKGDKYCQRLKHASMSVEKNTAYIVINLEEILGKLLVSKFYFNGKNMMMFNKRQKEGGRFRRQVCQCPFGFICHGCTSVSNKTSIRNARTSKESPLPCEINTSINCQNKKMDNLTIKNIVVDFRLHKSSKSPKKMGKHQSIRKQNTFMGIKRIFGKSQVSRKSKEKNTVQFRDIFSTIQNTLTRISVARD